MKAFKGLGLAAAVSADVLAYDAGDIIVRAGSTTVVPQESSDAAELNGAVLSLGGGTSELGVDSSTQLGRCCFVGFA